VTQPNRDLYQAGAALCDYVATNLTKALEHVQRELSTLDGVPTEHIMEKLNEILRATSA
jgi:hypothetical protein